MARCRILDLQEPAQPASAEPLRVAGVLGYFNTGTNTMVKMLRKYHVLNSVEPKSYRERTDGMKWEGNGILHICSIRLWKHTCPASDFGLANNDHNTGIIIMVRDPVTLMNANAKNPYDLFPSSGARRKQGDLSWLFQPCVLRTAAWSREHAPYLKPLEDVHATDFIDMWTKYYTGYLHMHWNNGAFNARAIIVRNEDVLRDAAACCHALSYLGYERNDKEVIDLPNPKNPSEHASDVRAREDRVYFDLDSAGLLDEIVAIIARNTPCCELLRALKYTNLLALVEGRRTMLEMPLFHATPRAQAEAEVVTLKRSEQVAGLSVTREQVDGTQGLHLPSLDRDCVFYLDIFDVDARVQIVCYAARDEPRSVPAVLLIPGSGEFGTKEKTRKKKNVRAVQ